TLCLSLSLRLLTLYHFSILFCPFLCLFLFFFNATPTTALYTLSLHDALPILPGPRLARNFATGPCGSRDSRSSTCTSPNGRLTIVAPSAVSGRPGSRPSTSR